VSINDDIMSVDCFSSNFGGPCSKDAGDPPLNFVYLLLYTCSPVLEKILLTDSTNTKLNLYKLIFSLKTICPNVDETKKK
jgi:hypothetical protein